MISTNLTSRFLLPSASSILLLILCSVFFFSEKKFYLSKGLNILHNIKTEEEGGKKKQQHQNQFSSHRIGQLLLVSCELYSHKTDKISLKFIPLSKI